MQSLFPNSPRQVASRKGEMRTRNACPFSRTVQLFFVAVGLSAGMLASGCRIPTHCKQPISMPQNIQKSSLDPAAIDDIQPIRIPFVDEAEKGQLPDGFSEVFPLTIRECEEMAARYSPLAAVLEVESSDAGPCQPCSQVDPCVRESVNSIIQDNASYQRNKAAENALMAYLGLVEVYLQNQVVRETIVEIEELEIVLKKLQDEGLLTEVDPELLTRKKLDIATEQNELLFNFESLNEKLRGLLGLERTVHPIWTECEITRWQIPTDVQSEIQFALRNRADLEAMQRLANVSNDQILETLRSSVRSASPLAGLVLERRLFGGVFADHSAEIAKLRTQLTILRAAQVDLVTSLISEHFYEVYKNNEMIQVNREKLASLRKSEARLEARRQVGPVDVDEVLTTKSEILKCRSIIIRSAVDLQRSWIKLKAAQGQLGQSASIEPRQGSSQPDSEVELIRPRAATKGKRVHRVSYTHRR